MFSRFMSAKNKDIKLLNYFPPQLWNKKRNLEKILKIARNNNPDLRTKIRMGDDDLALYTKIKGQPYYQWTPINKYGNPNDEVVEEQIVNNTRKRKEMTPDAKVDSKKNRKDSPNSTEDNDKPGIPNCYSNILTGC